MAGYSGTPLVQKLGIKADARVYLVDAPASFADTLGPLPPGVEEVGPSAKGLDFALHFVTDQTALQKRFAKLAARLQPAGMLWIAWPKRASGVPTDLTENVVRDVGLKAGLVDVKVCAIDDTWSGLKFVYRLKDRKEPRAK
jgi:hypothetical protein